MRAISIIFRRELAAYFKSPMGYVIAAAALFIDGLLFYTRALGPKGGSRLSGEVLAQFFYVASGTTMIAAILLSMRLIAKERESGSMVLLNTSPVRDFEIVLGKFLSAFAFLSLITLLTFYMPYLVSVNGKVSFGHVVSGYTGLLLLGGATLAIGMFATAIAPDQLIAGVIGAVITVSLLLFYYLSQELTGNLRTIFENLAFHHKHYWPFMRGLVHAKHIVYHLAIMYFFLLLAAKTLEAKRWR